MVFSLRLLAGIHERVDMTRKIALSFSLLWVLIFAVAAFGAERASLGLMVKAVTAEYAQFIGLPAPEGATIVSASAAGELRPGDVILKMDDRDIKTPANLQEALRLYRAGDQVQLQIARGRERLAIRFTLASAPVPTGRVRPGPPPRGGSILGDFPTVESARFEEEVLKFDRPVLAYFYANWCAPCKMYLPILERARQKHPDVKIVGIDIDKSPDIVTRYGVSGILPTVILFAGGREVDKVSRPSRDEHIEELLAKTKSDNKDIEVFASLGKGNWILQVAFIPESPLLAARDASGAITVWNHQLGALARTYRGAVSGLSPDGAYAALTDSQRTVVSIVDIVHQQQKIVRTKQFIEKLAVSPLGNAAAVFGADPSGRFSVDIWNPESGLVQSLPVDPATRQQSVQFAFSPDGAHFALATVNKLELFSTKDWARETVVPIQGAAAVLQFTSDSRAVLISGKDAGLIDLRGHRERTADSRVVAGKSAERLAIADNGDNSFRLLSSASAEKGLRFAGHRAPINAGAATNSVPWLASGSSDGTLRLWDQASGREVAQFVAFGNGEWIVITKEGYYNSSARGHEYLNIRRGGSVFGIDQFYDVFYRPDIVVAKLKGEDISGLVTLTVEEAVNHPPPAVRFAAVPGETGDPHVKVCYQIASTGGGIGEVRLFQNGKLVKSDGFYREVAAQSQTASLTLASVDSRTLYRDMRSLSIKEKQSPGARLLSAKGDVFEECVGVETISGENEIGLTAFNAPNTVQSAMGTIRFMSTRASAAPHLYILAVGIDRYRDASINLKYAAKDARDFLTGLSDKAKTLYPPSNIHLTALMNEQAGKQNILAAIDRLAAVVKHGDSFVFFDASHGLLLQSQYYIVTAGFAGALDANKSLISSNEIVEMSKKIRALSQLFIFDTCHAGGVDNIISGLYDARMSVLARKMGLHIYASAGSVESALDGYQGNGLYTYALLAGLKNGAQVDKDKSGSVTMKSLGVYSREMTADISARLGHPQTPVIINFGKDSRLFDVR
ncbi:MAG: PDZ domain-containing protein [Deltaproteobacteria bacterium]|nr:PDZ domain-containing protein [Deltaproteobacteria bacterium]